MSNREPLPLNRDAVLETIDAVTRLNRAPAQKPYLNLGCGTVILPGEQPAHHGLIDPAIYQYPLWVNADRNPAAGVDAVVDAFAYPWPWPDNHFDGALLSHLCEHIPHEVLSSRNYMGGLDLPQTPMRDEAVRALIHINHDLLLLRERYQDGWWAFFGELWRVLTPGAVVHVLSPYALSTGAVVDPSHTRYLMPATFLHSMKPDANAPFQYATGGCHFEMLDTPRYGIHPDYAHLTGPGSEALIQRALEHDFNVCYEFGLKLEAVKAPPPPYNESVG